MKNLVLIVVCSLGLCHPVRGQTEEETNNCVRIMLRVAFAHPCNGYKVGDRVFDFSREDVFYGRIETGDGWTPSSRKAAFEDYMEKVGRVNFTTSTSIYYSCSTVSKAVVQCMGMRATNTVSALRRLALNETYPERYRKKAIMASIRLGGVTTASSSFVESILTNSVTFSLPERGIAAGLYVRELQTNCATNSETIACREQAVGMFYRNRMKSVAAAYTIDQLLIGNLPGYAMSSNRLVTALSVLSNPEADDEDRTDFAAITNQLLSAGQPLQQLNFGGTEQ